MSKTYYEALPSLKVNYNLSQFPAFHDEYKVFTHCEYQISGDFVVIYQDVLKTVYPLVKINSIEYPYV